MHIFILDKLTPLSEMLSASFLREGIKKKRTGKKKATPKLWEHVFQHTYCSSLFLDCQTSQGQFVEIYLHIYIPVSVSTYLSKMCPLFWSHQMDILKEVK